MQRLAKARIHATILSAELMKQNEPEPKEPSPTAKIEEIVAPVEPETKVIELIEPAEKPKLVGKFEEIDFNEDKSKLKPKRNKFD
jgi:hypothetical protein